MLAQRRVHPTIPAADLDRARSWYADRLGFQPTRELPGGLMYDAAEGTRFIIFASPTAGKSPNTIMGFATPDIESEVRELKARGVVFEDCDDPTLRTVNSVATVGPTRSAWFRDSEGNILGVVQLPE
jgi:catechol 2,3-dioxygenase-like lactoylglutathione lyase family enzyme